MGKQGVGKEFILNLFLLKHKEVMEQLLGMSLGQIELEKPFGRNKLDFSAVSEKKIEVIMENQISSSDDSHLRTVINIIDSIQEGVVIWGATSFHPNHVMAVKQKLQQYPSKYIDFYCVQISHDVVEKLTILDQMYPLEVWDHLYLIKKVKNDLLQIIDKRQQVPPSHFGRVYAGEKVYDMDRIEDIKEMMLHNLRDKLSFFPNIHKGKKHSAHHLMLRIGAGMDGVSYQCSVRNQKNMAMIALQMDDHRLNLYDQFRELDDIREKVHPNVIFEKRKIAVYFTPSLNTEETVNELADLLKRFINYFSPFIYNRLPI
ncbi:hypothetical protein [Brevibacillus sp. MER 51]|uniref:hypothetical protein n=1 Tax=Brevibacillus sp. MER 51 TaxID=2939560 RepID=UPI0020412D3E|nr:hypothetical protein [Brevibacillus sp. MER 51]MCM3143919.1 hypothetical protein [Brevibacillus sp. MER 51]